MNWKFDINEYRLAPSGQGPKAGQWGDKPHRLVYDLCNEVERLRAIILFLQHRSNQIAMALAEAEGK